MKIHDRGYAVTQAELDMSMDDFLGLARDGQIEYVSLTPFFPILILQFRNFIFFFFFFFSRSNLSILVQRANDPTDQLIVFFPDDHSVGIKPIRRFVEKMTEQNVRHGILVIRNALTPSANKVLFFFSINFIFIFIKSVFINVGIIRILWNEL